MVYAYLLGRTVYIDDGKMVTKISLNPPSNDTPCNIPRHILSDLKEKYPTQMKGLTKEEVEKLLGY